MFLINIPAVITGLITLAIIGVIAFGYAANERAKALAAYTPTVVDATQTTITAEFMPITKPIVLHPCIVYEQHGDLMVIVAGDIYPIEDIRCPEDIAVGDVVSVRLECEYAVVMTKHKSIYEVDFFDLNANRDKGYKTMRRSIRCDGIDDDKVLYSAAVGRQRINVYGRGLIEGKIYDMWLVEKGDRTIGLITSTEDRREA